LKIKKLKIKNKIHNVQRKHWKKTENVTYGCLKFELFADLQKRLSRTTKQASHFQPSICPVEVQLAEREPPDSFTLALFGYSRAPRSAVSFTGAVGIQFKRWDPIPCSCLAWAVSLVDSWLRSGAHRHGRRALSCASDLLPAGHRQLLLPTTAVHHTTPLP
jgi:hypothetical protein